MGNSAFLFASALNSFFALYNFSELFVYAAQTIQRKTQRGAVETMATYGWGTDRSVDETLFREGHRFNFYQAVRLLEMMRPRRSFRSARAPDPLLENRPASSPKVSLDFPAGEVEVRAVRQSDQPEMVVNFLGLAGVFGPLPNTFTELIVDRVHRKDTAMRDF